MGLNAMPLYFRMKERLASAGMADKLLWVGYHSLMLHKPEKLLRDAGRFLEVLIGWFCALISGAFAAALVWLGNLIAWRNPRDSGLNDLYKVGGILLIFLLFL